MVTALAMGPARAQSDDNRTPKIPTITVSGNADTRLAPDEATVRLGVTQQASSARAAQNQVNTIAQKILTEVEKLGVKREEIQTSQLSLFPIYAQQKPGEEEPPRVVAYRATNTVSVRLSDLKLVGPVVDAGLGAGSNQVEGVSFGLRNDQAARLQALKDASQEAKRKAEAIAEALGVKLGALHEVVESGNTVQPFATAMFARGGGREDASAPVSPGQVTVNANVTVRYVIAQ
jgi:uncharacterized protein YggE